MIAPLFVLIADLALWVLWRETWEYNDDFLSLIVFTLAFSVLIWFIVELWQFVTSFEGEPR